MEKRNNYLIQARQARERFLTYDQEYLIQKHGLRADSTYLYTGMLGRTYRVERETGWLQRLEGDTWVDGNSHAEVMTLMDLLCDSREDRYLSGRWKSMTSFGRMFHQNLLEEQRDPWAERFQQDPRALAEECRALGGTPILCGDEAWAVELFEGLRIVIQFWQADEEFFPRIRYLWDENAWMYLRYETMYFAVNLLLNRLEAAIRQVDKTGNE